MVLQTELLFERVFSIIRVWPFGLPVGVLGLRRHSLILVVLVACFATNKLVPLGNLRYPVANSYE